MKIRRVFFALSMSLICAGSFARAAEKTIVLQCDLPGQAQNEWVQPQVIVAYETGATKALVADGVILGFEEKPIWADLNENGKRLLVTWAIIGAKDAWGNHISKMSYTLEYKKKTNVVNVRARAQGFGNILRGRGKCAPLKNRAQWEKLLKRK